MAGAGDLLSAYVLTRDSERLLDRVLTPLSRVADEILVLDSGSRDATLDIARRHGCRIETSEFQGFARQRQKAQSLCTHDRVLFVDSDEIMSDALVEALLRLKAAGFSQDAYRIRRDWFVLGRPVRAFYPVSSPDFPVRLFDRRVVHFDQGRNVHEAPGGFRSEATIEAPLQHLTFETQGELGTKLDLYSTIAAQDLQASGKQLPPRPMMAAHALVAFVKWYLVKGSWRDGSVGLTAGLFAARYTYRKYDRARRLAENRQAKPVARLGTARSKQ